MRALFKSNVVAMLAILLPVILTGCSSMRALTTTPPFKGFVLEKPAEFTFGLGTKMSLPAGEYKPVMEDDHGYYYQAPSKVVARDIFSYVADGGLYLRKEEAIPTHWYAIDQQNYTRTGTLPKNFQVKPIQ
jgi:hypothetical protein